MLLKRFENVRDITDIQIQSGCHRIAVALNFATDVYAGNVDIFATLRALNTPAGAVNLMDEMSLIHRLEIESADKAEGCFEYTNEADGTYTMKGSFVVGKDGALILRNGSYLSLDIKAFQNLNYVELNTIDHWAETQTAVRIDPFIINGVTKDIDLGGAEGLAIRPDFVKNLDVIKNGRTVPYTGAELYQLALLNNDLVSIDRRSGTAVFGMKMFSVLGVTNASYAKYTPVGGVNNLAQYLIKSVTI